MVSVKSLHELEKRTYSITIKQIIKLMHFTSQETTQLECITTTIKSEGFGIMCVGGAPDADAVRVRHNNSLVSGRCMYLSLSASPAAILVLDNFSSYP